MKCYLLCAFLAVSLVVSPIDASARDVVLPAGTLLQCTMNEPNFSSATVAIGDPVLCHLHGVVEFGQQAFPRGTYLVGHLTAAKDPGHFVGKGYLQLQFDRIGLPSGDLPLESKVIATNGYKVDREGKIDGKGHAKRDIAEWMLPPLWPWKVLMLPARGPRPKLKGESSLTLRLMDDVDIPQVAQTFGPNWHFFVRPKNGAFQNGSFESGSLNDAEATSPRPQLAVRPAASPLPDSALARASYATDVHPVLASLAPDSVASVPGMPVFVLTNGTVLSVSGYGYQDSRITYSLVGGGTGVISTGDIDWNATTRLNAQRGVRVTLHAGRIIQETQGL